MSQQVGNRFCGYRSSQKCNRMRVSKHMWSALACWPNASNSNPSANEGVKGRSATETSKWG